MGIQKLAGLAAEAFRSVKRLPVKSQAGMAALFGAGVLAGGMINCDGFEHEQKVEPKTETVAKKKVVTQPKEEKKEPEFKYVPPKIGEDGIVKADTTYYAGTKTPERIDYLNKDGDIKHSTDFNKDGTLKKFVSVDGEESRIYNSKGECIGIATQLNNTDGSLQLYTKCSNGNWNIVTYDKMGRQTKLVTSKNFNPEPLYYTYNSGDVETIHYNKDGSYAVGYGVDEAKESETVYDKNGKKLKEKKYKDGVLEYTVVPKYNKDGDVIKNDTIRNS